MSEWFGSFFVTLLFASINILWMVFRMSTIISMKGIQMNKQESCLLRTTNKQRKKIYFVYIRIFHSRANKLFFVLKKKCTTTFFLTSTKHFTKICIPLLVRHSINVIITDMKRNKKKCSKVFFAFHGETVVVNTNTFVVCIHTHTQIYSYSLALALPSRSLVFPFFRQH